MNRVDMKLSHGYCLILLGVCCLRPGLAPAAPNEGEAKAFTEAIVPLLETYCYRCHGSDRQKGGLNLASFSQFDVVLEEASLWARVLGRIQATEMPPSESKQMAYGERQRLMKWLRDLPEPELDCTELASDRTQSFYSGYVMSRRLTRHEYNNSVRDLFGLEVRLGDALPSDGAGGEGFDTNGSTLFVSPLAVEAYFSAADHVLARVLTEDSPETGAAVERARARLLRSVPSESVPARVAAREVVSAFAHRAYRRSVTEEEIETLLSMFDRGWSRGDGFEASLRLALKVVLVSPHFLFLAEPEPEQGGVHPLNAFSLASRLSYFLWASTPDDLLLRLAASEQLLEPLVYRQQIRRMLADPRAAALGERFALQWLELEGLGSEQGPDVERFPEYDDVLAEAMREEVVHVFNYIISEDRSLLELIESDYTFVNERLAQLYGIEDVRGPQLKRVTLTDRNRGGVLGMAAVHVATSYPLRTSPVLRGKWVLEVLLGDSVPPPPPDVPALAVSNDKVTAASLREQLKKHRADSECSACHDRMDPLGLGLENFDVLGRWRSHDGGQRVDASGTLPSGESFRGPVELKALLLKRKDQIIRHLVRKMTGYAFGRALNKFDECTIIETMKALQADEYRASILIEAIATSFPFRHRYYAIKETPDDD